MKTKFSLFITVLFTALFLSACATTPTVKSVVGEYERTGPVTGTHRWVLLENGIAEIYRGGSKSEYKWKIVDGEIHLIFGSGGIEVWTILTDKNAGQFPIGSLLLIAEIDAKTGKRSDTLGRLFKKIK